MVIFSRLMKVTFGYIGFPMEKKEDIERIQTYIPS